LEQTIFLSGPEDTDRLGRWLGRRLAAGTLLALKGDLGAGKTSLTQGLARGLGVPDGCPVVSPTFTLANEYPGRVPLYHLDLYRLEGDELFEAGLDEYFFRGGVCVVEWAEKAEDDLPAPRLEIELHVESAGGRRAVLRSIGPDFEDLMKDLKSEWA